jgi:ABC-type bacteriocin/lantibiotic exporter with double-glycine peptidase domain
MRKFACVFFLLIVLLIALSPSLTSTASDGEQVQHTHQLLRISQLDPGQYRSAAEYHTWAYSTCSTAAMTEVMNYYGHSYRITDVLTVESSIGAITPQLGLLQEDGITRTVARFGFQTTAGHQYTLNQVIDLANRGTPVIVSFPPERYPGGHLLVVTGGNQTTVSVADSSIRNTRSFTRPRFLQYWAGFAAVVWPAGSQQEGGQS